MDFETELANEYARLVRLCAWFTGNQDAAPDLAQETLIAAWKNQNKLTSPEKLRPWTSAIARNICLDWTRRYARDQAHTLLSIDAPDQTFDEAISDGSDLELELDRHELAHLLDRALSMLAPETRQLLVEHYILESSHAEIAAKMKLNAGTVAVRLQRGKLILKKLFRERLGVEAFAYGWMQQEGTQWNETHIWCPSCGDARLLGRYQKDELFALRCPICDPEPEMIMAGLDLTKPYHARLLGNVKTYKPAYARLLAAFAPMYQQALQSSTTSCLACSQAVGVFIDEKIIRAEDGKTKQIHLRCPGCGWASNKSGTGLLFSLPEVQKFWKEYPRLRTLPAQHVELDGCPVLVRQFQSVQDNALLTVISRSDSFVPIEIHSNVRI